MYRAVACPCCESTIRLLARKGVRDIKKINVDTQPREHIRMMG
jgi:hypothetical protein